MNIENNRIKLYFMVIITLYMSLVAGTVTWFNPESGAEMSIAPGVMVNTENTATDYKTGTEFHMDFVANLFVSESLAVDLRGYYYKQLTGALSF